MMYLRFSYAILRLNGASYVISWVDIDCEDYLDRANEELLLH